MFGRKQNQRGLTLVELIVVTGILGTMFLVVQQVFRQQAHTFRGTMEKGIRQGELRTWLTRMTRDVRRSGYDPLETRLFGIVAFTPTELRLTFDANGDGAVGAGQPERTGYRWDPATEVLSLWQGGTSWRPVLQGVRSMQFTYLDRVGNPAGTDPKNVHLVEIAIEVASDEARKPGEAVPLVRRRVRVEVRNVAS